MATEVEIRALISDPISFRSKLSHNGFERGLEYEQRDIILDLPDGSLFKAGRKIRLRVEGEKAELTYKGSPVGDKTASRRSEVNIQIAPSQVDGYISFFESLGFPVLYQVTKAREIFESKDIKITLDLWPVLGYLAEIEGAEDRIKDCAASLFPEIEFKNFRLKELFAQVCSLRGRTLDRLVAEHEKQFNVYVGDLASAIG